MAVLEREHRGARREMHPVDYQGKSLLVVNKFFQQVFAWRHSRLRAILLLKRRPKTEPDFGNYTVPGIDGPYSVGPFMHPGGGVVGGGRAAAVKTMEDMGIDFDRVVQ